MFPDSLSSCWWKLQVILWMINYIFGSTKMTCTYARQVFSSQSISYTHIGIPWLYIFLPSRRSKIWNKTVHSFHSLEENIGDICDDLQKMCFVVVFLKKKFFWNLDKSSMYLIGLTDSSKGVKLTSRPKDQLKIVLCTSSQSGWKKLLLAPAKIFPIIPIKMSGSMSSFEVWKKQTIIYKKSSVFYTIIIF